MRWVHVLTGFHGRMGRRDFWIGSLSFLPIFVVLMFGLAGLMRPTGATQVETFAFYASQVVALWISAALIVKRLHDRNKSAFWYLLFGLGPPFAYWLGNEFSSNISNQLSPAQLGFWLLSLVLWVWAIVELGFLKGTAGPNRFGPAVPSGSSDAVLDTTSGGA